MVTTGLANAVLTGLVTGSVIALGAIGLSLVYSIAEVPNFAHGELLMLGAYMALFVNKPGTVPFYKELTTSTQVATLGGMVVLFLLAVVGLLGTAYHLDGWAAITGSWIPGDVSRLVGTLLTLALASVVGGLVLLGTPSVWGGLLLSMILLAAFAPLQEKYVFGKFREKGTDLATMLIVALGLSFVLRFTTQAVYGGGIRGYRVPGVATVGGVTFPLSAAQFFDFFATGSGVVLRMVNTGVIGSATRFETIAVVGYPWVFVAAIVTLPLVVAVASYRWRLSAGTVGTAGQTVGPKLTAAFTGIPTFLVLAGVLAGSGSVPNQPLYSTRISISFMRGLGILVAVAMMGVLHVLLKETKLGTAMRASSDNIDLAKVTGINTDRVMMATWIIAGAYAAIAGVMLGTLFAQITPNMGFFILLPVFAGVILGGVGSVYGAMLGSFLVGLSMDVGIYLLDIGTTLRVPVAFAVLFVVLLVKPEGIMGRRA